MEPSPASDTEPTRPKLSICISTWNRAKYLKEVLDSVLPQITAECEVLVVDNASTDNTGHIVLEQTRHSDRLRYVRKETNHGMDANFDRAVELARGDYCWLLPDDDLARPGAISAILKALQGEPSAVLVNYEFRDASMSKLMQERVLDFYKDRMYGPWELERMFIELGESVRYIGILVIRRSVWMSRQRGMYFGSYYGPVGMMYEERFPRYVHVIAQPYVSYRIGSTVEFPDYIPEVMFAKWPALVTSLPFSERSKRTMKSARPWKHVDHLLYWRGIGMYSYAEYRKWIRPQLCLARERLLPIICALTPRSLATMLLVLYLAPRRNRLRQLDGAWLAVLEVSPWHLSQWASQLPRNPNRTSPASLE